MINEYNFESLINYSDFDFIEIFRDKEKKKTFWKLKCKKCNEILNKEQYQLFNETKRICCFTCEGKKEPKSITEEIVINSLKTFNSNLISIEKNEHSINLVTFKCECGNIDTKIFDYDVKWKCNDCTYSERKWPLQKNVEDFIIEIKKQNCIPLFDISEYKNVNTVLFIKCSCGNIFKKRFSDLSKNKKIKCRRCISEDRSGENHWNWKGGTGGRRFQGENHWDKKIKRKFNYTCCITGNKINKGLVAHHLDGYASNEEKRQDMNNGVCLTEELHKEFHSKYDKYKGTCTRDDFFEFFKEKTGKDFLEYLNINNIIW